MGSFLCNRKFCWNFLLHKKPYRAGSHCGGKVVVARGDPPQAENPTSRILFYVMKILQSKILSCIIKMFDRKFYRKILERV